VRRFFEEKDTQTDTSEALQISLQGGLKFSIHLNIGALYGVTKTFFVSDQAVNEARDFLHHILDDQN
jgi:hypothetical protein